MCLFAVVLLYKRVLHGNLSVYKKLCSGLIENNKWSLFYQYACEYFLILCQ